VRDIAFAAMTVFAATKKRSFFEDRYSRPESFFRPDCDKLRTTGRTLRLTARCLGVFVVLMQLQSTLCGCGVVCDAEGCPRIETNQSTCREYVAHVNRELSRCDREERYDADATCPDELNWGADCTTYYECLADSYRCIKATGEIVYDVTECVCE
jgi:hypothetical protein